MKKRLRNYAILILILIPVMILVVPNIYWTLVGNSMPDEQSIPLLLKLIPLIVLIVLILYTIIYELIVYNKRSR